MLTTQETIEIITVFLVFIGVVIALIELYQMRKAQEDNYEISKKQSTIEFFNEIKNLIDTNEAKEKLETAEPIPVDQIKNDDQLEDLIIQYLSYMERYAVGVNIGAYDITVFDRIAGRHEIRRYNSLSKYIEHRRNETGYPYLYGDYEEMVEMLKYIRNKIRFPVKDLAIIKKELTRKFKKQ